MPGVLKPASHALLLLLLPQVYKALRNGAQTVAVKVIKNAPQPEAQQQQSATTLSEFRREVAILRSCRDPNVVSFLVRWGRGAGVGAGAVHVRCSQPHHAAASAAAAASLQGACLTDDGALLVLEYCEGGNLSRNIAADKVSWYRRGRKIAGDIAKGLVYLHSRRIVHLDVKSSNILLARCLGGCGWCYEVGGCPRHPFVRSGTRAGWRCLLAARPSLRYARLAFCLAACLPAGTARPSWPMWASPKSSRTTTRQ